MARREEECSLCLCVTASVCVSTGAVHVDALLIRRHVDAGRELGRGRLSGAKPGFVGLSKRGMGQRGRIGCKGRVARVGRKAAARCTNLHQSWVAGLDTGLDAGRGGPGGSVLPPLAVPAHPAPAAWRVSMFVPRLPLPASAPRQPPAANREPRTHQPAPRPRQGVRSSSATHNTPGRLLHNADATPAQPIGCLLPGPSAHKGTASCM